MQQIRLPRRRFGWVLLSFGLLYLFLFFFGGDDGLIRMFSLRNTRNALSGEMREMERERSALAAESDRLKNDPQALERVARERYGLAKPGEKVIRFTDSKEKP